MMRMAAKLVICLWGGLPAKVALFFIDKSAAPIHFH
jgi:hypothetical protein